MTNSLKPILVTGSHRSGSTWVGRIIAASPLVGYIHEPFNVNHRPGICKANFSQWFTYLNDQNGHPYLADLSASLQFKYQVQAELKVAKNWVDLARLVRDYGLFSHHKLLRKRPLMKDPIAFFSTEWLVQQFDMDVVMLIRHPAAFVSSLKKAQWTFPFQDFLQQPLLMQTHLQEFRPQILEFSQEKKNVVEQGILLWNIIHSNIIKYQTQHPEWVFVTHEAISINPLREFAEIFTRLQLPFSEKIRQQILSSSSSANPVESKKILETNRNSKSNIKSWKNRLDQKEIELIQRGVDLKIYAKFYSDSDWL